MSKPKLQLKAKCGLISTGVDLIQILSRVTPAKRWGQSVAQKAAKDRGGEWYWVMHQHISVEKTRVMTLDNGYRYREKSWALIEWVPVMSSLPEHWHIVDGGMRGPVIDGGNGELALQPPATVFQNEYMTLAALDASSLASFQQIWPGDESSDSSDDYSEDDPLGWDSKWLPHFYGLESTYRFQVKFIVEACKVGSPYGLLEVSDDVSDDVSTARDDTRNGDNPWTFPPLDF